MVRIIQRLSESKSTPTAELEESISQTDFTPRTNCLQNSNFSCQLQESHKDNELIAEFIGARFHIRYHLKRTRSNILNNTLYNICVNILFYLLYIELYNQLYNVLYNKFQHICYNRFVVYYAIIYTKWCPKTNKILSYWPFTAKFEVLEFFLFLLFFPISFNKC